jgi:hypothetical protein
VEEAEAGGIDLSSVDDEGGPMTGHGGGIFVPRVEVWVYP